MFSLVLYCEYVNVSVGLLTVMSIFYFLHFRAVFETRGGLPVVVDPIEAVGLEPTTGAPSAESNSDTKKVSSANLILCQCNSEQIQFYFSINIFQEWIKMQSLKFSSVPTATERHMQNVHYAAELHIVPHFVNERIGQVTKLNV